MFNGKLEHRIELLEMEVQETNRRLIEIKQLILQNQTETLGNRVLIEKQKNPVRIIEKEVTRTRKKKKPALRTSTGWTKITEAEKAQFMELYAQGLGFTEMTAITGRSSSSISKYIRSQVEGTDDQNN